MTKAKAQKNINRLEAKWHAGGMPIDARDIISDLNQYAQSAGYVGTTSHPKIMTTALISAGYKAITQLSKKQREGQTKESLLLCIVGNFIDSEGKPPTNVMARFCEQYLG